MDMLADSAAIADSAPVATRSEPAIAARARRLPAIDRLRGLVIVLMALDHVRDYFTNAHFAPTDLSQTTPALFFTRWVTHYCAPIFIFLAGTSARLMSQRTTPAALRRFLVTRGLWLVLLEFTLVNFVWTFNFRYQLGLILQVIWATGASMVALAALSALPLRALAAVSLIMIAGHNLLDGIRPEAFGSAAPLWNILHVHGEIAVGDVLYPLIPWIGVMSAGYVFGGVYQLDAARRRRVTIQLGLALSLAFVLIRWLNGYGDPAAWSLQPRAGFSVLSFLNVSKYPPSLLYLLMTLGPGLLLLAALDHGENAAMSALETFGRVPLFAYVMHLAIAHTLAGVVALALGFGTGVLTDIFVFFPKNWGFGLAGVYCAWLAVIVLLYPLCQRFAAFKRSRSDWWVSYL